jgi:hypothetical protein
MIGLSNFAFAPPTTRAVLGVHPLLFLLIQLHPLLLHLLALIISYSLNMSSNFSTSCVESISPSIRAVQQAFETFNQSVQVLSGATQKNSNNSILAYSNPIFGSSEMGMKKFNFKMPSVLLNGQRQMLSYHINLPWRRSRKPPQCQA